MKKVLTTLLIIIIFSSIILAQEYKKKDVNNVLKGSNINYDNLETVTNLNTETGDITFTLNKESSISNAKLAGKTFPLIPAGSKVQVLNNEVTITTEENHEYYIPSSASTGLDLRNKGKTAILTERMTANIDGLDIKGPVEIRHEEGYTKVMIKAVQGDKTKNIPAQIQYGDFIFKQPTPIEDKAALHDMDFYFSSNENNLPEISKDRSKAIAYLVAEDNSIKKAHTQGYISLEGKIILNEKELDFKNIPPLTKTDVSGAGSVFTYDSSQEFPFFAATNTGFSKNDIINAAKAKSYEHFSKLTLTLDGKTQEYLYNELKPQGALLRDSSFPELKDEQIPLLQFEDQEPLYITPKGLKPAEKIIVSLEVNQETIDKYSGRAPWSYKNLEDAAKGSRIPINVRITLNKEIKRPDEKTEQDFLSTRQRTRLIIKIGELYKNTDSNSPVKKPRRTLLAQLKRKIDVKSPSFKIAEFTILHAESYQEELNKVELVTDRKTKDALNSFLNKELDTRLESSIPEKILTTTELNQLKSTYEKIPSSNRLKKHIGDLLELKYEIELEN